MQRMGGAQALELKKQGGVDYVDAGVMVNLQENWFMNHLRVKMKLMEDLQHQRNLTMMFGMALVTSLAGLAGFLGPIRDRFGIARVWVHQLCGVWSPEVYFAGLGCLKNVRAALCRGRALKCSRCGRPGATIGCRVDRCPKTYHLPCSRVEGCIFDHRKFLIACNDHRRFFQPHGNKYSVQLKKMKARKQRLDLRKISNESRRKDLEAEEKWLENCGEDEEFLRREGRRLQRDIVRIAPAYIGGSSENDKMYQGWESVAGLEHVIQCMKEVVMLPLLYPDFFTNLGLTPPRGVLLHGYPGTGKTHVVRALIGACSTSDKRIAYFARKGADCLGKYVGDAERQLRLLFQVAEKSQPSIIFFDEIDGLAPRRSKQQDQTHSSVVSTLLSLLDGLKSRGSVIVIGATNRPDAVDPALRRPGRFDREIYFPLPSEKDRSAILSLHTRSWPKPLCGSALSWIANQTVGYAGADLQALCTQAAMHALKRNCALQGLLSSAEKGTIQGILSTLPSFDVEERDWLVALTLAPPPCSRREAGIAANDIVSSPLPIHLVPSLLLPLVHLLISLYNDERIWLSPLVLKVSKTLKNVIVSALELKRLTSVSWQAHLHILFKNQLVVDRVKKCFAHYGLIIGPLGFDYPFIMDDQDNEPPDSLDSVRMNPSVVYMHRLLLQRCPLQIENSVGFRALICGTPRSGQKHLASCLLHGFVGNLEIRKVSLATIAQEGRGDMLHGLTQILLKCLDVGRCIIYMPRIDLWAIEGSENSIANDSNATPKSTSSSLPEMLPVGRSTSEIWNSFVEQLDSVPMATSLAILATCEVEKEDIPPGLRQFFLNDTSSHSESNPTEYRIPRFFIQLDDDFNLEQSINLAAAKLSHDIVQHYLKLMHERSHSECLGDVYKGSNYIEINSEGQDRTPLAKKTIATTLNMEHIAASNDNVLHGFNNKRLPQTRDWGVLSQRYGLQGSFPRASKVVKGNLILAIATFGYQILRYPQFAELCWVTSKLKEGPCTDINGPWKGWPFNTCVLHADCSPNKAVSVANTGNTNDKENSGVVRGLIAVGLLAYRGFYSSVVEVSAQVRNVLELLVAKIRAKISLHADKHRYLRILSQAAYLDDMVNSWAYMLQSLQADNNIGDSNPSKAIAGHNTCNIVSPHGCFTINGEKELNDSDAEANAELTSNGFTLKGRCNLSNVSCLYLCCPGCVQMINNLVRSTLLNHVKSTGCHSMVDDVHDVIVSCSLNILSSFMKCCSSQSSAELEEEEDGGVFMEFPCHCRESKIQFLPKECVCHAKMEDDALISNTCGDSILESRWVYFFRDGVLVPLIPEKGVELHCNFEKTSARRSDTLRAAVGWAQILGEVVGKFEGN
ncbi:hypothetical protein HPP92_024566 [Vanilla planifolia]|uniref:PHD-type domain-containing protein n=1 Tax=Vanilla planifolia TaxID=51239 RepID=A0A835UA15_VANPL|nr:hypothetical protein HPP92_024566 [Vanilla planifolia]